MNDSLVSSERKIPPTLMEMIQATPSQGDLAPLQLAEVFSRSGFFDDSRDAAKALVKIIAGKDLGMSPIQAMMDLHIVKGKIETSAKAVAKKFKDHPHYDYTVTESTTETCSVIVFKDGKELGVVGFTIEEAKTANLIKPNSGWAAYPSDMLFARAITRAHRRYAPDLFSLPVYFEGEVSGNDTIKDVEITVTTTNEPVQNISNVIDTLDQQAEARKNEEFVESLEVEVEAPLPEPEPELEPKPKKKRKKRADAGKKRSSKKTKAKLEPVPVPTETASEAVAITDDLVRKHLAPQEELATNLLSFTDTVPSDVLNELHELGKSRLDGNSSKAFNLWKEAGVDVANGEKPTAEQARFFSCLLPTNGK